MSVHTTITQKLEKSLAIANLELKILRALSLCDDSIFPAHKKGIIIAGLENKPEELKSPEPFVAHLLSDVLGEKAPEALAIC